MRVLVVESEASMARSIEFMLRCEGMNVYQTEFGEEAVELGKLYDLDIIVLELQLPDLSGFEVLKALRLAKVATPVLILTGNSCVEAKVKALGFGADDYLTKPFHKDELVARIEAVVRRSRGHAHSVIQIGKLRVDLNRRQAFACDSLLPLTYKQYQLLELLCLRKGALLTREMILNHLYEADAEPESNIIDVFVRHIRKKIADATAGDEYIQTEWGRGYRLVEPPVLAAAQ